MKRLITALSVLTLGTTVGNLSSSWNINQKVETANTLLKENMKEVHNNINLSGIDTNNNFLKSLAKNKVATLSGGENYYSYYFLYHVIGLKHETLQLINNAIGAGIGAVAAILSAVLPAIGPIVSVVAALLIAQWYVWQVPTYDNGNAVSIKMFGFTPTWIVSISAQ